MYRFECPVWDASSVNVENNFWLPFRCHGKLGPCYIQVSLNNGLVFVGSYWSDKGVGAVFPCRWVWGSNISVFSLNYSSNWLCVHRETALLIDPKNSCSSSRQWVALVVGHELAHQWFGNLVTMVTSPSSVYNLNPSLIMCTFFCLMLPYDDRVVGVLTTSFRSYLFL